MILFLYGQDGYRSFQKLTDLKARYIDASLGDTNLSQLDVARCSVDELTNTLLALPFLAKTRLVVLNRLLSQGSKSVQEAFVDLLTKERKNERTEERTTVIPDTTVVVVYEPGVPDRRTVLFKTLLKVAKVQEFTPLTGRQLQDWMVAELATIASGPKILPNPSRIKYGTGSLQKEGVSEFPSLRERGLPAGRQGLGEISAGSITIEPAAASKLATLINADTWRMATELRKLALATIGRGETVITPEVVSELVIDGQTADVFALGDALARTNPTAALQTLRLLASQGESPQYLVALVAGTLRTVALIRDALDSGQTAPGAIAHSAGLAPFVVGKHLAAAKQLSSTQISDLMRQLAQLDLDSKRGRMNAEVGLELFVLKAAISISN